MRVRAKFIGQDGSCGYLHGMVYLLNVEVFNSQLWITSPNLCPYSSFKNFLDNWEVIN